MSYQRIRNTKKCVITFIILFFSINNVKIMKADIFNKPSNGILKSVVAYLLAQI
jgi:hypothetical protein